KAILFGARFYGYIAGITPNDLRLLTALMIVLSLILGQWKSTLQDQRAQQAALWRKAEEAL
ncbi:MAG: ABC transporter permease, partial [Treponema sp.]|nr:ABC transporter permease [Treponema sp.]